MIKINFTVEVDEIVAHEYDKLSNENKAQINEQISGLLKKAVSNARSVKLKKIVSELKNDPSRSKLNSELLCEFLRTED